MKTYKTQISTKQQLYSSIPDFPGFYKHMLHKTYDKRLFYYKILNENDKIQVEIREKKDTCPKCNGTKLASLCIYNNFFRLPEKSIQEAIQYMQAGIWIYKCTSCGCNVSTLYHYNRYSRFFIVSNTANIETRNEKQRNQKTKNKFEKIECAMEINNIVDMVECDVISQQNNSRVYTIHIVLNNNIKCRINKDVYLSQNNDISETILVSLANGFREYEVDGKNYYIIRSRVYNQYRLELNKHKTNPYTHLNRKFVESNQDPVTVHVYRSLRNIKLSEDIQSVTILSREDICNHTFNAYWCPISNYYFVDLAAIKNVDLSGFDFIRFTIANSDGFNEYSPLYFYGYNVANTEINERQNILTWILDNKLMSKYEICSYLEQFIRFNGAKKENKNALNSWIDDKKFIENYNLSLQTVQEGNLQLEIK